MFNVVFLYRGQDVSVENLITWLKVAFVLCRKVPFIVQEVSRLLTMIEAIASTNEISLETVHNGYSETHWCAYFHISSVGAYHMFQEVNVRKMQVRVPNDPKEIKTHLKTVLAGHNSSTIVVISLFGMNYVEMAREFSICLDLSDNVSRVSPNYSIKCW
ncbi:hypothetical protein TSUD_172240 [Trifolium subterraneum]|uniref:Uncharacterized protein n=1 Tax=Trifolium subterraneum TaxID=3900 RepID=A0A2Z6N2B3_TRISU|nr:hypothetical protein TSUD_172240 [Trifolium subterraneum]